MDAWGGACHQPALARVCVCTASLALWHQLQLNLLALEASGDFKATPGPRGEAGGSQAHILLLEVVGRGQASWGSRLSHVP